MATATPTLSWRHDYEGALNDARQHGKLMLLDFSAAPM
jgi:hypothetical protein